MIIKVKFMKRPKDMFDNEKSVKFLKNYSITFNIRATSSPLTTNIDSTNKIMFNM